MSKAEMPTVVIERSKWSCWRTKDVFWDVENGRLTGNALMTREGGKCCFGFALEALGATNLISQRSGRRFRSPQDWLDENNDHPAANRVRQIFSVWVKAYNVRGAFVREGMKINDFPPTDNDISTTEKKIAEIFEKLGLAVEFVGEFPQ